MKILIKNGYIIDMVEKKDKVEIKDILIENERIKKVDKNIEEEVDKVINATRKSSYARINKWT